MKLKQLDLFAGIGGLSLAAEWAGIETVAFCEKEPFAQGILRRRFPNRPIYDDVFNLTREVLENDGIYGIDIVAGGFPCQPFSNAGKRAGTADDRYLWPEMCRIVGELRPSWVFAENVDGLVSMAQSGGDLVMEDEATICTEAEMVIETIRKDLKEIGYQSIPVIIPACSVGASHRRYRIFILGHTECSGRSGQSRGRSGQESVDGHFELEEGALADADSFGNHGSGGLPNYRNGEAADSGRREPQHRSSDTSQIMADSTGERCGEARASIERSTSRSSGSSAVADTSNEGLPQRGQSSGSESRTETGTGMDAKSERCSETLADSHNPRMGSAENPGGISCNGTESRNEYPWRRSSNEPRGTAQSGMGRGSYGIPDWLDGWGMNPLDALINFISSYPQPALMGQEQHNWEPPRVATGVKNRVGRLKALGNAVDPLQALPVLYGIKVMHEHLLKGGKLP